MTDRDELYAFNLAVKLLDDFGDYLSFCGMGILPVPAHNLKPILK
jgi:hypothetical protein